MFEIDRVFHLTHVVDDLDATLGWYDRVLGGQPLRPPSQGPTGGRICLVLVGDLVLMPMTPSADDAGGLRFRSLFGQHLHSLAWFVADRGDLIATLEGRGLSLRDEHGRPLEGIDHEIWVPPRQAPCLLEFYRVPAEARAGEETRAPDPRFDPGWSPTRWREHPLGIEETACVTVVTDDPEAAIAFFSDTLRGRVVTEVGETAWATRSVFIQVGGFTVVEVAQPVDQASRAARDLEANGGILHAATFRVADLDRAVAHLVACGLRVERPAPHAATVDPESAAGLLLRFTDRPITAW